MTAYEYAAAEAARLAEARALRNAEEMAAWVRDKEKRARLQYALDLAYAQFVSFGFVREGHSLNLKHERIAFAEVVQKPEGARIKWAVRDSDFRFSELEEEFNRDFGRAMGRYL